MEQALNLELLRGALDSTLNLPTAEQLRQQLADAEVRAFFAGNEPLDPLLRQTAWNLHHVGTVRRALELYGLERQVQANQVAAHIFDLILRNDDLSLGERLVFTFAAQVSSLRGDKAPNAAALARRLTPPQARIAREPGQRSLELGCTILGLDRAASMAQLRVSADEVRQLEAETTANTLRTASPLAAAIGVFDGCRLLQRYLTNGDDQDLAAARESLAQAISAESAQRDLDSRWVAAHLLDLCDDLGENSVWSVLPPDTPPQAGRAMTLGTPPVMTLWPPQVELLSDRAQSPVLLGTKRAVLTFPTSAGKTLLAQMVIAHHLSTQDTGVCVVAPSHSLCREIRDGLDRRLWALRKTVVEDGPLGDPSHTHGPVVVMTPEKLSARLRANETELLDKFGLFVLDEAHLVGDATRGWTFETTIARLHQITEGLHHRLILLSAALGGTASVRTWLGVDDQSQASAGRWRGPRRLNATYTATPNEATRRVVPPVGRQRLPRVVTDLRGVVRLYVDQGDAIAARATPLGERIEAGKSIKQPSQAEKLKPIVALATAAGPVLTVHATKKNAESLATALASDRAPRDDVAFLVRLAELRLGATHPLVAVLRTGIAYHHAALPVDVQVEIESAVRDGVIDVVCATTTLAEGVNLPVRTVIVCERGFYDGSEFHELIDTPALLNAAGRAGRAGRETEGWVIVAYQPWAQNPRQALREIDQDHDVESTLATSDAFSALAEYERLVAESAEIVLTTVPHLVDGFLAYCWYLADAADVLGTTAKPTAVLEGIRNTLAWQQLPEVLRGRWEALATQVLALYEATDVRRRRRWATSGARLSANAVLELVATSLRDSAWQVDPATWTLPLPSLDLLLGAGRLEALLGMLDKRDYQFKRRRYGRTEIVDVDVVALVTDWVTGTDLTGLTVRHLSEVEGFDEGAFRFEQLSTFLARVCEHHLPWATGTVIEWVEAEAGIQLCQDLPALLHYGVSNSVSLQLMAAGVRSRRIAVAVGDQALAAGVDPGNVRSWLAHLGLSEWRARFSAGTAEIADLLQFSRDPSADTGALLLDGGSAEIGVTVTSDRVFRQGERYIIRYMQTNERPRRVGLIGDNNNVVATVRPTWHHDLAMLIDAGFRLHATLSMPEADSAVARVELEQD